VRTTGVVRLKLFRLKAEGRGTKAQRGKGTKGVAADRIKATPSLWDCGVL
jgi:hypothetical protein